MFQRYLSIVKNLIKQILHEQTQEIDTNILNFLKRRINIQEKSFGYESDDIKPLKVTEYTFEGLPGYGFNSFATKKEMVKRILNMLYEQTDLVDEDFYSTPMNVRDPKVEKIMRTVRVFLNQIIKK